MNALIEPLLLTVDDAARVAGLSRSGLYRELAAGRIEARKLGGKTLVTMASLRRFVESLPAASFQSAA